MKANITFAELREHRKFDESYVKEIITDESKLGTMVECIDPVKQGELVQEITLALKNTIRKNNLQALSAPAIGYPYRIFCIAFDNGENIKTFINPTISYAEGFTFSREKCSSIPGKEFIRPRNTKITLQYFTPLNKLTAVEGMGKNAYVMQHEIDHVDGVLLSDLGLEIDELYDQATDDERAEVLKAYCDALDISTKKAKEEIQADPELKQIDDAINYMIKKQTGEIEVEQVTLTKEEIESLRKEDSIVENLNKEEVSAPKKRGRKKKEDVPPSDKTAD